MLGIAVPEMSEISRRRDRLVAIVERFDRWAVGEPGCRRYTFAANRADPSRFVPHYFRAVGVLS